MADEIPEAAVLPPADLEAVKDVAAAIEAAFRRGVGPIEEARAAIAAARPHLSAAKEAEITRLRAELAEAQREIETLAAPWEHCMCRSCRYHAGEEDLASPSAPAQEGQTT